MKKASKKFIIWTVALAIIIILALLMLFFPKVADKVGEAVGKPGSVIRNFALTMLTLCVGLMFVSWGVAALALSPVLGGALIVIGVSMVFYSMYTSGWFTSSSGSGNGAGPLNIV